MTNGLNITEKIQTDTHRYNSNDSTHACAIDLLKPRIAQNYKGVGMVGNSETIQGGEKGVADTEAAFLKFEDRYLQAFEAMANTVLAEEVLADLKVMDGAEYGYYRSQSMSHSSDDPTDPITLKRTADRHFQNERRQRFRQQQEFIATGQALADLIAISMLESGVEELSNGDRKYKATKGEKYYDLLVSQIDDTNPMPNILTYSNIVLEFDGELYYPSDFENHVELYIDIRTGLFNEFISNGSYKPVS